MPIIGVIGDPLLESIDSRNYATFACMLNELFREFHLSCDKVVLMFFSLQDFGDRYMRSSQHCTPESRPRWKLDGSLEHVPDLILCDYLIFFTPMDYENEASRAFFQFPRLKRRVEWNPPDLKL